MLATRTKRVVSIAYLCFARVPLMAGYTNLIKQAMQLADDGGDLLGEVARVHGDCRPASRLFNNACTGRTRMKIEFALRSALGEAHVGGGRYMRGMWV
jgi:hypothetical protein